MRRISLSLFRHHVGTTSRAARWYLAIMGALSLLLLSVHFSLQLRIQQEASQLAREWLLQAGGTVEDVRFHLLNGQLALKNIRLDRNGISLQIPTTQINTSLQLLIQAKPHLNKATLFDVQMLIPDESWQTMLDVHNFNAIADMLHTIDVADIVHIRHGVLRTRGTTDMTRLEDISIEFSADPKHRDILASAQLDEGHIQYRRFHPDKNSTDIVRHEAILEHVETSLFTQHFPWLEAVPGLWSGNIAWSTRNRTPDSTEFSGEIAWDDPSTIAPRFVFSGKSTKKRWSMQADATDFPVQAISAIAPRWHNRQLASGFYTGSIHLSGNHGFERWRADFSGNLLHALYQSLPGETDLPDWSIHKIEITKGRLEMPERKLSASRVFAEDGNMGFEIKPHKKETSPSAWTLTLPGVYFSKLSFSLWDGEKSLLQLPALRGKISIKAELATLSARLIPDSSLQQKEEWRIKGDNLPLFDTQKKLSLSIHARAIPLHRFRHLLPNILLPGKENTELEGDCNIDTAITRQHQLLQWRGKFSATNTYAAGGGDSWRAEKVALEIIRGGPGASQQHLRNLIASDWHYQAALRPLRLRDKKPSDMNDDTDQPGQASLWQLDSIELTDGSFSVGRPSAVWADHINMSGKDFRSGKPGRFDAKATFARGAATLSGSIDPFSIDKHAKLKGELWNALPFFLNDWLSLSGAPIISRGRLSAKFSLLPSNNLNYEGIAELQLTRAAAQPGAFPDDPLLKTASYSTHSVFTRLSDASGSISLSVPIQGDWKHSPLNTAKIGSAFVAAIEQAMRNAKPRILSTPKRVSTASIRLHENKPLSLNERKRLSAIVDRVLKHKRYYVELTPLLGKRELDSDTIDRVRFTQNLIDTFLSHHGVPRSRQFPVWPHDIHREGEGDNSGIQVIIYSK